jgi:hypothetical protein
VPSFHGDLVKRGSRVRQEDLAAMHMFAEEYSVAELFVIYGGTREYREGAIRVLPASAWIARLGDLL